MDLLVVRGRAVLVKTRTRIVNAVRGIVKSFGYRLPPSSTERSAKLKAKTPVPLQTKLIRQVWGVGRITSVSYLLTIEDKQWFAKSREVGPYLRMRPRRSQSSESDPELGITKAGDCWLGSLLVECAQRILSDRGPDTALKQFGLRIAAPGKKNARKRAIVAVARKPAVLLHKFWVTGEVYEPFRGAVDQKRAA